MSILLLAFVFGSAVAQLHGPDPASGVTCYDCGGHGADHQFPACLMHTKTCHHDEVCQVTYGGHHTEVKCHRAQDCHHGHHAAAADTQPSPDCPAGGVKVHGGCQLCCTDNACVTGVLDKIGQSPSSVQGIHCPGECPMDNINLCVSHGHVCRDDEFCRVTKDESNGKIHATCEPRHDIFHCQSEAQDHHCDPRHHHCVVGCCEDDQCVGSHFGLNATNSQTTVEAAQTTVEVVQTTVEAVQTTAATGDGSFSTLTCGDLANMDCDLLANLCPKIHCPVVCDPCMNPGTGGQPDTTMEIAQSTPGPTMGTDMPDTSLPVVTDAVVSTTAGGAQCEDTIQNMQCSDVADVCSSPLLVGFCQKHCGMC